MTHRVGIDIGGTFTDIVLLGPNGKTLTVKVPSTPDDYSRSIASGLADGLREADVGGGAVTEVIHGTTVATNAILEHRGVHTGLITTAGFRDVLEIRRLRMPHLYDLNWEKPPPLVAREDRLEVKERIDAFGAVVEPLDAECVKTAVAQLLANGVQIIAVALINAYANDDHERRIFDIIREIDQHIPICLSCEVHPEIKEYERTSTTVVNAYILPVVSQYLNGLAQVLNGLKVSAPLRIMQSNGGTMGAAAAAVGPGRVARLAQAARDAAEGEGTIWFDGPDQGGGPETERDLSHADSQQVVSRPDRDGGGEGDASGGHRPQPVDPLGLRAPRREHEALGVLRGGERGGKGGEVLTKGGGASGGHLHGDQVPVAELVGGGPAIDHDDLVAAFDLGHGLRVAGGRLCDLDHGVRGALAGRELAGARGIVTQREEVGGELTHGWPPHLRHPIAARGLGGPPRGRAPGRRPRRPRGRGCVRPRKTRGWRA